MDLPPLPPLNFDFGSSAASRLSMEGASWGGFGAGDWNVNVAGSGTALMGASSFSPWMFVAAAAAAAVAFAIFKK